MVRGSSDPRWCRVANPFESILFYIVFLFSVTLHEAAHAWVAMLGGDLTAYRGGQVSINPVPHIRREPFGMVILPLISVFLSGWPLGFASAPYDPSWARRYPKRAAVMSLAGPAANLLLFLLAALAVRAGLSQGTFVPAQSIRIGQVTGATSAGWESMALVVSAFFSLNLVLFVLNILPVPPLDGSGALPLFLSPGATARYQEIFAQPMVGMVGMLVTWRIFGEIFRPVFLFCVNLLYPGSPYG